MYTKHLSIAVMNLTSTGKFWEGSIIQSCHNMTAIHDEVTPFFQVQCVDVVLKQATRYCFSIISHSLHIAVALTYLISNCLTAYAFRLLHPCRLHCWPLLSLVSNVTTVDDAATIVETRVVLKMLHVWACLNRSSTWSFRSHEVGTV
jgi:hypothetical protein